ncbi:MAG: proteasome subunit beta [Theionarchaea archaeon]|nr:proteasome subunit beta [Theionarchaea archaeon]MBU7001475.1 proteasome subunit beta [Theionarchaea archaeon]MBU7022217.1 proteasome subunit beta [Theionarchaea archaeon]MBU7035098.1 proteasome subunit beta [Theionarchaea archaeon]MBU7040233.1 proteasome subunit beta [Theionarchaea archaeon]
MDKRKGTTTVVLVLKNGVVFAADKQASAGMAVASKTTHKIFQIDDHMAVTVAGSLGDAQNLVSLLKAEINLANMEKDYLTVKAVASLTSRILHQQRFYPYIAWLVLGGHDERGPSAFSIDPLGGVTEDSFIATGSGMQTVYGLLEDQFNQELSLDQGTDLALRAIRSSRERDLATGGGIALSIITPDGYKEFSEQEVKNKLEEL